MASRVFLSRTSEFAEHPPHGSYVAAAQAACAAEDCVAQDMTAWTAASQSSAEHCRERVRQCDVYVGIIGFSYGSPVTEEPDRSYTQLEYEEAKAAGMKTYVFLLAKDGDMPLGLALGDTRWAERQTAFRRRLEEQTKVAYFRNPEDLQRLVGEALRSWHSTRPVTSALRRPSGRPVMVRSGSGGLVDRSTELTAVVQQVRRAVEAAVDAGSAGPPVVALLGAGGFGKSTLAAQACRALDDDFADGVLWADVGEQPSEQHLVKLPQHRAPARGVVS